MRGDDEYRGGRGGGYEDRQGPLRGARRQDQGDNQYGRNDRYGQMDENHNNRVRHYLSNICSQSRYG